MAYIGKVCCGFVLCSALACRVPAQVAEQKCRAAGKITLAAAFDDSYSSATVAYQLSDPSAFSAAWIEVWDRPTLLFRTQVPTKKQGQIVWAPEEGTADTPSELQVAIHDPELPNDPTNASRVLIGSTGPVEGGPVPELLPETMILEEGASWPYVTVKGKELGEHNTLILLIEQEGPQTWIAREYLPAVLADLEHVRVQIPSGYLSKPTLLQLEAVRVGGEATRPVGSQVGGDLRYTTIYVMSKDRPLFSTIEPSELTADEEDGVTVRILGSGFTAESQVLTSFQAAVDHDSGVLKPVFISSHELQVTMPSYVLFNAKSSPDGQARLWVRNGDDRHVSDSQTFRLLSTAASPLAGAKRPSITSVSPYPVPLMDYRSPAVTRLKIYGENFRKGDTVVADIGDLKWDELRTSFISSQELNVWLPREMWRQHRLSFRLVTKTSSGTCAAEAWAKE